MLYQYQNADAPVIYIVGVNCQPEHEEKFNSWYDEVHIPQLLKFEKLKEITRCRLIDKSQIYPKYLTMYKFDTRQDWEGYLNSPERIFALQGTKDTWKGNESEMQWQVNYEVLKFWQR